MSCTEIPKMKCQLYCDFLQQQRNICVKNSNGRMDQHSACLIILSHLNGKDIQGLLLLTATTVFKRPNSTYTRIESQGQCYFKS